jgi:hypothetical protein
MAKFVKDFQKLVLLVGEITGQENVDVGRIVKCKGPCGMTGIGRKVAVFLPSANSTDASGHLHERRSADCGRR